MSNIEQLQKTLDHTTLFANVLIIAKWEKDNFTLGEIKKAKLMEKPTDELILHLDSMSNIPAIIRFGEVDDE